MALPTNPRPGRNDALPLPATAPSGVRPLRQLPQMSGMYPGAAPTTNIPSSTKPTLPSFGFTIAQSRRVETPVSATSSRSSTPSTASNYSTEMLLKPNPRSSVDPEKAGRRSNYGLRSVTSPSPRQQWLAPPPGPRSHFSLSSGKATSYSSTSTLVTSSGRIALSADPDFWVITPGTPGSATDDWLHNPDPKRDRKNDKGGTIFTRRGLANVGCIAFTVLMFLAVFGVYPIINRIYFTPLATTLGGLNLGGINETGQVPVMAGNFALIDKDTPQSAYTKSSFQADGTDLQLVFSDEFNVDGRTFYPGDDPYWEAEDMHYWATNNLEWYDPAAVTTQGGNLVITLSKQEEHGLNYQGGLLSSWNKFCFTGGLIEISAILPGASNIEGLWPAVWAMGNLGRMGYGASLEGMWPYTYNSCDVGTLPNQTFPNGTPVENTVDNDPANLGALSYLPGQRLSACTCAGEDHPGPKNADGSFVGRGVPEIDILEATIDHVTKIGKVSQSAQWAPFNLKYEPNETPETMVIHEPDIAEINSYIGGAFQQTTSALVQTNNSCAYEASGQNACYSQYGFEYKPGNDGYITWISDGKASWTVNADAMTADAVSGASQRPVSQEPMYIIANLGMSFNFGPIDFAQLQFPARFYIDYVRVYQPKDQINVGCSPDAFPTEKYIQEHIEAYTNANLTTWEQYGGVIPKNKLIDSCSA
ncbi:hypothetical protein FRC04_000263 [Tulasnella sp. 424]|nr:hypothetical protein FRC04_000263 [Tulasnella sp. 424]KAG8982124.1 hypothetical protein FRC05_000266 [Tulasnella sp. 425]